MWINCQRIMKKQQFIPEEVTIKDNRKALLLVPDQSKTQLAIIPLNLLQMLKKHLCSGNIEDVKTQFATVMGTVSNMQEWVQVLRDEHDFHISINMMDNWFALKEEEGKKAEEPTLKIPNAGKGGEYFEESH